MAVYGAVAFLGVVCAHCPPYPVTTFTPPCPRLSDWESCCSVLWSLGCRSCKDGCIMLV